jgi:hypothetical protein
MKKFEYKTIIPRSEFSNDTLNKLGSEGWELILVNGVKWIFKREIEE